ncbi:response regulator transcription factor [Fulvivirga lutea]|uniref:Response regulator transcription factor n=1 Tax=Fulvivirga lutea TaxID=2810512 RepID=A0A975A1P6_9BACT|nr:response regulator transcription factor [Fulvivirga lutea]QSE98051.1 response regulator transcription factor [Fulvivirga lutea]
MNDKQKILLVEDDPNLGQILKEYLELKGYHIQLARDGEQGKTMFAKGKYNLCLLDVMMPKIDGFELGSTIREIDEEVPIIYLTAKSMKEDTIKGFKIGADDYITKPFSMEELLLRIKAIFKRVAPNTSSVEGPISLGSFTFDPTRRLLAKDGEESKLTTKENELLKMLVSYQNKVLTRTLALKHIWGDDSYFNARSMDVYITKLRKHLKADENIQILTIHGEGFKLVKL